MGDDRIVTKDFCLATVIAFLGSMTYFTLTASVASYAIWKYGVSASEAGLAAGLFVLGGLVARIAFGRYTELIGRKRMLMAAMALGVLAASLYFFTDTFTMLCVTRLLHGAAYGICSSTVNDIVTKMLPKNRAGEGLGYFLLSITVSTAVGPYLALILVGTDAYDLIFTICMAMNLLSLVIGPMLGVQEEDLTEEQKRAATKVTMNANVITATIPATQIVTAETGSKDFKPDMNYAYMWAANVGTPGSDVPLGFKPLMTAFEFSIVSSSETSFQLASFVLRTDDESPYLAGDFTATVSEDLASCPVTSVTNGSPSITVNLGDVEVTQTVPVTFTVFARPQQLTNLTMQFNLTNGITQVLDLKQRASESDPYEFVTFEAGKKYRITNLAVPADGWIYTLEEVEVGADMALNSAAGGTATKTMKTYRTKGTTTEEVAMKFRYSPADVDGNCANDWKTVLPAWLESLVAGAHTDTQAATDPFTLTGTYKEMTAVGNEIVNEILDHIDLLKQNGNNNRDSGNPQDLALYDIDNLDPSDARSYPKTANSYVVDRAGWYMFPVVYGNAIDGEKVPSNGWNVGAYYDGSGNDGWDSSYDVLHRFRNYLNVGIQSPYVLDDVNLDPETQVEAVLVWEDASEENLFLDPNSVELIVKSSTAYKASDGSAKGSVPFIRFHVYEDKIRQGNAVIALRELDGDKRIIWSWHIWVTDTDLNTMTVETRASVNPVVASNQMLKVNLGWCDTKIVTEYSYAPRKYFVEVTQEKGNADPVVFTVTQSADPYYITFIGASPFYQYGRKDPLLPDMGELRNPVNKDSYSPYYTVVTNSTTLPYVSVAGARDGNVSYGIQNPYIMYGRGDLYGWVSSEQRNLWDMTETATLSHSYQSNSPNAGKDKKVIKTIYDPCPPGFSVPNYTAFTIFTKTGGNVGTSDYSGWATENPETEDGLAFALYTNEAGSGEKMLFPWQGFRSAGTVYAGPFYQLNSKSAGDRYSVNFNLGGTMRDLTKSNAYQVRPIKEHVIE